MSTFWKKLRNITSGPNTIGKIGLTCDFLQSELGEYRQNNQGRILVSATPLNHAEGYDLRSTLNYGPDVAEVYWLPWKNHSVTEAMRDEFECSNRNLFFMTTTMTGCRFSITPTSVLHIAHSIDSDAIEENITGPRDHNTRRLLVSPPRHQYDFQYGGRTSNSGYYRALVFGMRVDNRYIYKYLDTHQEKWVVMFDERIHKTVSRYRR
ncbi:MULTISPECIES: BLF1 family deaminating toxin [Cysteiniphilum]|uniref:Uncharacterized protein n=1 Tax=Cysteiniphilum litorale TaxID=2056700 RepID=A0A8J3E878_9GAMM|nr:MULTISPECIES: BLF1 family deaminating toxin [Cysteiniphilum]GGF90866.1 hypothetical protein GCM10010995_05190 [Cysteiniphilum litorale]